MEFGSAFSYFVPAPEYFKVSGSNQAGRSVVMEIGGFMSKFAFLRHVLPLSLSSPIQISEVGDTTLEIVNALSHWISGTKSAIMRAHIRQSGSGRPKKLRSSLEIRLYPVPNLLKMSPPLTMLVYPRRKHQI